MNAIDVLLARAQVWLAFLFAFGFLGILALLLIVPGINKEVTSLLTNMMTVLGTLLTLQMNYFFARQRSPTVPDPTVTTSTSTTTTTPSPPNGGSNASLPTSVPPAPVPSAAVSSASPFRT